MVAQHADGDRRQTQREITRQNQPQRGQAQDEQLQPALSRATAAPDRADGRRGDRMLIKQYWA